MEEFVPGTVKPEEEYEELSRLGAALGIPVPQTFITLEVTTPEGELLDRQHQRSRTWVRNFWNQVLCVASATSKGTLTGTYGAGSLKVRTTSSSDFNTSYSHLQTYSASNYGYCIRFGSGTTAESFEAINLANTIANGVTAGTLVWAYTTQNTPSYDAASKTWTNGVSVAMTNSSGGTITITEVGLFAVGSDFNNALIARDLLSSSISVPATAVISCTYSHTLVFPA